MNEFSVPITPLHVALNLTDGRTISGDIFLPAKSPLRHGPMLAAEWVNLAPTFIPVRSASGELTVVNRQQVVSIALEPGVAADDPLETLDTPAHRVEIALSGGVRLEGLLAVAMPRHQQRVVDWLNGPDAHLTLDVGGRAHLVLKAHVLSIVELDEA
jgi:hypothetical protein